MTGPSYEQAVWSWTEHLRGGGGTPWRTWLGTAHPGVPPVGWTAPGAAQLELVRRLARRSGGAAAGFTALADIVLGRSGPGRGLAQQPLCWTGSGPEAQRDRRFGPPPVDPVDVPHEELVRLAVGTLAELVLSGPGRAPGRTGVPRLPLTRDPAFRLAGAPVTAAAVRRDLGAAGYVEGGRSPRVVLLALPFVEAMAQVWSARVQRGSVLRWHGFLDTWAGRRELPSTVDLSALARRWADRVGSERVQVLVGSADVSRAAATTLGARLDRPSRRGRSLVPTYAPLAPAAVDVARRVNAVLGVRVTAAEGTEARRAVVELLGRDLGHRDIPVIPRLGVARRHESWAHERAAWLVEELRAGGYPVRGRLDELAESAPGRPTRPRLPAVLRCALGACLEQAAVMHSSQEAVT